MQEPTPAPEPSTKRIAGWAALSLLGFSALCALGIFARLLRAPEPWSWQTALVIVSAALALAVSVLVWRAPTRLHVGAGMLVMLVSLARLGAPSDWTFRSFIWLGVTMLLMAPLARAAFVLR